MFAPRILTLAASLLLPAAALADEHFPLPPSGPLNQTAKVTVASNDRAPSSCDGNLLSWMKDWRQRARSGYVNMIVKDIPSMAGGAHCIKDPEAYDVQYIPNGDYFVATCLAASNGKLTHLFKMDINVPVDQSCLGDSRFNTFVNTNHCHLNGPPAANTPANVNDNQAFLDQVMKTCAVTPPHSPIYRDPPQAYAIDVNYFARILAARPEVKGIVDEQSMKVKLGQDTSGDVTDVTSDGDTPVVIKPKHRPAPVDTTDNPFLDSGSAE